LSDRCSRGPDHIPVDHILSVGWIKLRSPHYAPFNSMEPPLPTRKGFLHLPSQILKLHFPADLIYPQDFPYFRLFLNNNPRQSLILTLLLFSNYGEVIVGCQLQDNLLLFLNLPVSQTTSHHVYMTKWPSAKN